MNRTIVRAGLIAAAIVLVQAALIAWFSWPASELEPRHLPVVVAGPAEALQQRFGDAFDVTSVPDEAAADRALRDREAYAAFVPGPGGLTLHVASAASPTVATLLSQAAAQATGAPVTVRDVVPNSADDPRGAGFAAGFLPLVLTSLAAGAVIALLHAGRAARIAGVVTYAVLAGLVGAAVLTGMGLVSGYGAVALAVGLLALAIAAGVAGLGAALGPAGIGLGVLLVFLIGNPISAVAAAPELLPRPWGTIGQLLPSGAGATLIRSAAYFDWAGSARALWALVAWSVVGLALLAVGRASLGRRHPA